MPGGWRTIVVAVLSLGAAPAAAMATPRDVASTHAYIVANYAFVRASEAKVASTQTRILGLNKQLARECPHAGAGSLQSEEAQKLSYEVVGALWSISYGADSGPIHTFVRAVKPLRWSSGKLTSIEQRYTKSLLELASLPMPAICADVRAWSASGFRTVPAVTIAFDRHAESIEGHSIPSRLLTPYAQPADRSTLERTTSIERKLEGTEVGAGFSDWDRLLETLGLPQ
jgi:hypothetical protein